MMVQSETTVARARVLEAIGIYTAKHGYAPTIRDLCAITGVSSTSFVNNHLRQLRDAGKITFIDGKTRTIRIVEAALSGLNS